MYLKILGVFARSNINRGSIICSIPGYFFPSPTQMDHHRHYVWDLNFGKHLDSTCFRECVVLPNGFGQFINTSHPKSLNTACKLPNAVYECQEDFTLIEKANKNIKEGEEILCNYHWQLAVIDRNDGLNESESAIASGQLCFCPKCDESFFFV